MMVVAALIAIAMFYGVSAELEDGIVHHKRGGMSVRTTEPFWFWLDIALQIAIGLFFTGLAILAGFFGVRRRP
ncbi:hypothetical protein [Croceibacterium mercuriale]|uniref:hypothetical protein n=1 Tax=Croceibacterium mercuriale TaxID=1572751 RepID=UPI00126A44CF|nr:hypothetical protein [Croceibacterium mercuriale]